ncbi:hypothetical protein F4W67_22030 [Pseudomonas caricapapayae]|nr:hypothetical protein F4W67_22030 [Pseudomonas caricapapayae]
MSFWCARVDDSEAFGNKSYRSRRQIALLHAPVVKPHTVYSLRDVVFEIFWRNSCVKNKERHRRFLFT